jgi:hypothetical protein
MSKENPSDELGFGQKLLGLQGFNAARAKRYREEISKLLIDRISSSARWQAGIFGVIFLILLGVMPIVGISSAKAFEGFEGARWTFSAVFVVTGTLLGGWMFWVAIKGGYGRRAGDLIGTITAIVFCGGSGSAFIEIAWATDNSVLRTEMLFSGAMLLVLVLGCLMLTLLQRMNRQTQEKLLRIEYHLAELMERSSGSSSV